jgi:flavin reductase (DIM6/NTAB) family NADH-FMN oxidoreductase RutF
VVEKVSGSGREGKYHLLSPGGTIMGKHHMAPDRFMMTTPVVLVSAWGASRRPNIITVAWTGVICGEPPMVYVSVRPSRHSHRLLEENGDFVINLPAAGQAREVDLCGTVSGRKEDKFALCGFTPERAAKVDAPVILECPVNLECRSRQRLDLGIHDAFLAEVINIQASEDIFTTRRKVAADFAPLVYSTATGAYQRPERIRGAVFGFSRKKSKEQ